VKEEERGESARTSRKPAALFPKSHRGEDDKGKLKRAMISIKLRQDLSEHIVDGPRETISLDCPASGRRRSKNAPPRIVAFGGVGAVAGLVSSSGVSFLGANVVPAGEGSELGV